LSLRKFCSSILRKVSEALSGLGASCEDVMLVSSALRCERGKHIAVNCESQ
jgi:hypothetical protein